MRPMPRDLMIHSATLALCAPDAYGAVTLTPVAELTRVRVETTETLRDDGQALRPGLSAVLWYDARHSGPRGVGFAPGQMLLFEGRRYRVETVEARYGGRRLHHVELGLSG
ncbi:MAG: hypothetical protein GX418_09445 [Clostridiales bacterium]|nr:hypothetical protein [Clostridiales bacterium]